MPGIVRLPNGLATKDTPIGEALIQDWGEDSKDKNDRSEPPSRQPELPVYQEPGSGKESSLVKNEDREVREHHIGATYEVKQFSLWKEDDMKAYQDILTSVGVDGPSKVVFQDRVYIPEHQSWKVLLEIAHYCIVAR